MLHMEAAVPNADHPPPPHGRRRRTAPWYEEEAVDWWRARPSIPDAPVIRMVGPPPSSLPQLLRSSLMRIVSIVSYSC
jgi:hypothetical protein